MYFRFSGIFTPCWIDTFGIRDAATAKAVAQIADAVVIGSRLVQEVELGEAGLAERLRVFLAEVRAAMDSARLKD